MIQLGKIYVSLKRALRYVYVKSNNKIHTFYISVLI
jgi:hypothetical protein